MLADLFLGEEQPQVDTQRTTTTIEKSEAVNLNPPRELEKPDQRLTTRRLKRDKVGWKYFPVHTQLLKCVFNFISSTLLSFFIFVFQLDADAQSLALF